LKCEVEDRAPPFSSQVTIIKIKKMNDETFDMLFKRAETEELEDQMNMILYLKEFTNNDRKPTWKVLPNNSCSKAKRRKIDEENDDYLHVYESYGSGDPKPFPLVVNRGLQFIAAIEKEEVISSVECTDKYNFETTVHSNALFIRAPSILTLLHPIRIAIEKGECYFLLLAIESMKPVHLKDMINNELTMKDFVENHKQKIKLIRLKNGDKTTIPFGYAYVRFDIQHTVFHTNLLEKFDISGDLKLFWNWFKETDLARGSWVTSQVDLAVDFLYKKYEDSFIILAEDISTYIVFDVLLDFKIKKFIKTFDELFQLDDFEKNELKELYRQESSTTGYILQWIKDKVEKKLPFGFKFLDLLEIRFNCYLKLLASENIQIGVYTPKGDIVEVGLFAKKRIMKEDCTYLLDITGNYVKISNCLWKLNDFSLAANSNSFTSYLVGTLRLLNHNANPNLSVAEFGGGVYGKVQSNEIEKDTEFCIDYGNEFTSDIQLTEEYLHFPQLTSKKFPKTKKGKVQTVNESSDVVNLLGKIHKSSSISFLLGAGISADIITPFRDPMNLEKSAFQPLSNKELMSYEAYRVENTRQHVNTRWFQIYEAAVEAEPTKFHKLLLKLQKQEKLLRVYTQNVDGLEKAVGLLKLQMPFNIDTVINMPVW
jgi:hypothetical protein